MPFRPPRKQRSSNVRFLQSLWVTCSRSAAKPRPWHHTWTVQISPRSPGNPVTKYLLLWLWSSGSKGFVLRDEMVASQNFEFLGMVPDETSGRLRHTATLPSMVCTQKGVANATRHRRFPLCARVTHLSPLWALPARAVGTGGESSRSHCNIWDGWSR